MNFELAAEFFRLRGEPKYRLGQAKRAFFVELAGGWDEVTVFPKALRLACAAELPWISVVADNLIQSKDDNVRKALFVLRDGEKIESVLMRHGDGRNTVCVSSQVGCPMACAFCATGTMGFVRNLSLEEIRDQVVYFARELKAERERVSNVVVMGMGEPFHNYDAVLAALHALNDPGGLEIGARMLSVSTCGVVPGILRLADEPLQCNLAISLHAATDELRDKLMPVNRVYPLQKLMPAVRTYMTKTNRRVMFEYLLLKDVNDRPEDALALAQLFGDDRRLVYVNLIKYHVTQNFSATSATQRDAFLERLHALGIPATLRMSFGEDIQAACGQLRLGK